MNKEQYKEFGKQGAKERWKERYRILEELKGLYGKNWKDHKFIGWSTEQLRELLENHKNKNEHNV